MSVRIPRSLGLALCLSFLSSGCVAPLIVTGAMAGGQVAGIVMEDDTWVEIDEVTVDPKLAPILSKSKRWLLVSSDPSTAVAARVIEDEGGYEVFVEDASSDLSRSQMRRLVDKLCNSEDRPDIVIGTTSEENDMGAAELAKGLFTGKVNTEIGSNIHVYRCRDNWESNFAVTVHVKEGVYTTTESEMVQKIGRAFGKSIVDLVGERSSIERAHYDQALVSDIQRILADKGYYKSTIDGLYGPSTSRAISEYQADHEMQVNGVPSRLLLDKMTGS